ncbi:MAG TPA: cytidylate kinase-like family protein [Candidatus Limnocylindrales bacterium]|jgi:cytidylate kinase|nr:cytidylate kinase-like family protein [Candidatus Limnocylindrales bacterium]
MIPQIGLENCLSFINCQIHPPRISPHTETGKPPRRAITISRQSGSGGHCVAEKLVAILRAREPEAECAWTVFDRELVAKVLADHHLPSRLARFMPEDKISEMADTIDELFGLHPPSWTLVHKSADTILHLAELGKVILIGRGANVITQKLDYVFHVRLVGSLENRVRYMEKLNQITHQEALELVCCEDLGRKRYLKKYFRKDIDDPLLYHMVLNTDMLSHDEAAHLIADAILQPREPGLSHAAAVAA